MSGPIVSVPVSDLKRVLPFKGEDDIRYYLNGVLVTPYQDHALLVATNGHWLAVYESADAHTDTPRILDLTTRFVRQISDLDYESEWRDEDGEPIRHPQVKRTLSVASEQDRLVISESDIEVLVKPGKPFIDGKFPEWTRVLPNPAVLTRGAFTTQPVSPKYLGSVHKAVPDEYSHGLYCYQEVGKKDAPILFRFEGIPEMVVALMPRRDAGNEPTEWPAWMTKTKEQTT